MRVLLLTGPPGAGKTTTLGRLSALLTAADVRHALLEVEALAHVNPWPDDEAAFAHLALLARSFRERGYPLLLVGATVDGAGYLPRTLDALGDADVIHARLHASTLCLRRRVQAREPAGWQGLPRLLDACARLAREDAALPGVALALDTEAGDVDVTAGALRRLLVDS